MADAGFNAQTTHSGDGVLLEFSLGFKYVDQTDVVVKVGGTTQVNPTHYSVASGIVTFVTAPPSGTGNVVFTRDTPHDEPVEVFADGSTPTEAQFDRALRQVLNFMAEVEDKI